MGVFSRTLGIWKVSGRYLSQSAGPFWEFDLGQDQILAAELRGFSAFETWAGKNLEEHGKSCHEAAAPCNSSPQKKCTSANLTPLLSSASSVMKQQELSVQLEDLSYKHLDCWAAALGQSHRESTFFLLSNVIPMSGWLIPQGIQVSTTAVTQHQTASFFKDIVQRVGWRGDSHIFTLG